MGKAKKNECCEKYRQKDKFCKGCPLAAGLKKKQRKRLLRELAGK